MHQYDVVASQWFTFVLINDLNSLALYIILLKQCHPIFFITNLYFFCAHKAPEDQIFNLFFLFLLHTLSTHHSTRAERIAGQVVNLIWNLELWADEYKKVYFGDKRNIPLYYLYSGAKQIQQILLSQLLGAVDTIF